MRIASSLSLLLALLALLACDDGSDPTVAADTTPPTITVDAVEDWAFVALGERAATVSVADPATSDAWDMAFFATSVMLNGGDAGPAGVEGFCVCQNAGASDADVLAMTAEEGLSDFQAVSAVDVPAVEEAWKGDGLDPAIDGWWTYDPATHVVSADPSAVWKLRTADGAAFAKMHVTAVEGATREHAGVVTLEFAVQPAAGEPFGPVHRLAVDLSGGIARVDLQSAAVTDAGWDVALEGYTMRVNGGASGDGLAGALPVAETFGAITDAGDLDPARYAADAFGGVFTSDEAGAGWYRYNLIGRHQIWPTYNVYLVRRGDAVYKVQLIGYYGEAGHSRHVTLRYQRIQG